MCVAVIGIDRYRGHPTLRNAVNDARGVLDAFEQLGFERAAEPLLDGDATQAALIELVRRDLPGALGADDSLVLFFAGHGHNENEPFDHGPANRRGYLLPVEADHQPHTWLDLAHWLEHVAALRARHILVILDSCHSGVALDRDVCYRGRGAAPAAAGDPLRVRPSRRVITSALDDEPAHDSGPVDGHSLFAGCLIDAVLGGIFEQTGKPETTGSYLGVHVRDHVRTLAGAKQNPALGTLEGDHCGELFLPLGRRARRRRRPSSIARPIAEPVARSQPAARIEPVARTAPPARAEPVELDRSEGWALDPAFAAALDRHGAARAQGYTVLSVIAGDAMATRTAWATWAARRGCLTLRTDGRSVDAAVAELLEQTPWLRCLPEARRRLGAAARISVDAIDASLAARSRSDRRRWIHHVAPLDRHAQVSGWLLSALREPAAALLDVATAPVRGGALLAIACDLACPTAVLIDHAAPDAAWLERAIGTAAALTTYVPQRCVAVTAPAELVAAVLGGGRRSAALTMARQGLVRLGAAVERIPGRGRRRTARALLDALAGDPRTRGRFEADRRVPLGAAGPSVDVGLVAMRERIVVELDGWHHVHDPEGYERARVQDRRLQRAGYFVLRFLAEDVDERLASTIEQIALALASRRLQGDLS